MDKKELYNKIENYLLDELSHEEKIQFEKEISLSEELKNEVDLHKSLHKDLSDKETSQLISSINEVNKSWKNKTPKSNNLLIKIGAIIALVILLLFAIKFFWPKKSNDQLFADYNRPYQMIFNQRSVEDNNAILIKAINAYENKNYVEASSLFETLSEGENNLYLYYALLSKLSSPSTESVSSQINTLLQTKNPMIEEQLRWYLAISYIKDGDLEKAKNTLLIIKPDQYNYSLSRELLNEIN